MDRKFKGIITVYLSLTLMVILSLITAVIGSAREKALRARCEITMDMGMQSVFAEYNRQLLKEFDLYFIDDSYGTDKGDAYYIGEHLKDYMSYNLNPAKGQALSFSRELYGLSLDDASVVMSSLATDSNAEVYKRQAIHFVKDKYGLSLLEKLTKNRQKYDSFGIDDYDAEGERRRNAQKVLPANNAKDAEGNKISFSNPADKIENHRSSMIEALVGECSLSGREINLPEYATYRELKHGDGIIEKKENTDSAKNDLLFDIYLADKFSCYTESKGREGLSYEMEYILYGNNSDKKNLEKTVKNLLLMREAANCIYIFTDEAKKAEVMAVVEPICALLLMPELAEPLTNVILFAWAYAESCVDVRTLLDGGKVPIMKDSSTWVLKNLTMALNFRAFLRQGLNVNVGLNYKTYLSLFLIVENSDKKVWRSIDMIECDLRQKPGNSHFKMDNCVEYIEALARVKSSFGYSYNIRRFFGYEEMPTMVF